MKKNCSDMKEKVIILGASVFAEEVADLIDQIGKYDLVGFVEGIDRKKCRDTLLGLPIVWIEDVGKLGKECYGICAVGSTKRIHFIEQALSAGLKFMTAVHPTAQVSDTSRLGQGTIISPGVIIASHTTIGSHVIVNRGSMIGHHARIGDYVTISPGANIAGRANISDRCYIGMGSIIIDGISIGNDSFVGAGSVVTKNVPSNVQVLGVPARITKELND